MAKFKKGEKVKVLGISGCELKYTNWELYEIDIIDNVRERVTRGGHVYLSYNLSKNPGYTFKEHELESLGIKIL